MQLETQWISAMRDGQAMVAYQVRPLRVEEPLPAVLVIQEVWGPDEHIQDVARRVAMAGYTALAPDLYSRGGRPKALAPARIEAVKSFLERVPPAAWMDPGQRQEYLAREPQPRGQQIGETLGILFGGNRDMAGMAADLKTWADYLREEGAPGVASVGYCMGGALSFLLATRDPALQGAVVYYGNAPAAEEMQRIACPVLGFYGGTDHRITDAVPDVQAAMQRAGKVYTPHVYATAGHAFFNDTRASYHVAAARDAWARTLGFFAERLGTR